MRRLLKYSAWTLVAVLLLAILLGGTVLVAGNTDWGRGQIERLTYRLTDGYVKLSGLGGAFPAQLSLTQLQLIDSGGVWLTADGISLRWSPLEFLKYRVKVQTLHVTRLHMERLPISSGSGGKASVPDIEVGPFSADLVELGAPLAGTPVSLSLKGTYRMPSIDDADTDVIARRLNGDGEYKLHLHFDSKRMDASLAVHEPASGPLENILSVPGLGALTATATLAGPRDAERLDVDLAAGALRAEVHGTVDLAKESADLNYAASAPAMAPRADLAWESVALQGTWHGTLSAPTADGRLDVVGLRLADTTKIAKLKANLTGSVGRLNTRAVIDGLEIPGSAPRLFARSAVAIDATLQMSAPGRPLEVIATHPLLSLRGRVETEAGKTGEQLVTAEVKVPNLGPFSVLVGEDVRGSAVINANLIHRLKDDRLSLKADLGLAGGTAPWLRYVGSRVGIDLQGSQNDKTLSVENLRVASRGMTLVASGRAARAAPSLGGKRDVRSAADRYIKDVDARWQLDVSDLTVLSSDIAGSMKASGRIGGTPSSLFADAELRSLLSVRGSPSGEVDAGLHLRDLPSAPSGTLRAQGTLDGAPLTVDTELDRTSRQRLRLRIRDAEWKTSHIQGDVTADSEFTHSHGQLALQIEQLSDFDRLLGMHISGSLNGSVAFLPNQAQTEAKLQVDAKDLVVGRIAGNLHLSASGVADELGLKLTAELPDLSGAPATVASAGTLNIDKRELQLTSASVDYHAETIRLLSPALLSFAKGFSVDEVKIGAKEAVVDVKGELAPELDLRASLRQVKPDFINVLYPGLLAAGIVEADVRLKGSPSSPTGRIRMDATGLRFADDAATGLPPVDIHARARLADDTATVNASLTAGTASKLTVSGTTPLDPNGALAMKIAGVLDVGLANPLLEARGMHATGALTVDATVTGSSTDPLIGGGITLAKGSLRDYGHGVNLSDITAEVIGQGAALEIKNFSAKAATGRVDVSGTFGVLEKDLPLDLKITAKDAQPIASNIVTADLDADIRVNGTLRQRLDVAGKIDVHHATIGIPNSLPPDVAVLDVRRRGKHAPAAVQRQLVIGIDVTVDAPQQVLVQGRGLDADMAGRIQLSGTTDALVASGGLNLVRGSISIAGARLNFTHDSKVSFDGTGLQKKIDPVLDFTVNNTVGDTTATLTITGPADAPVFQFTSNPPGTPPDQIMSMLLFNTQNPSSLSALQLAQIGYALASLSGVGAGGFNPLVKLQKTLGLDRLSVGSNTTNTPTGPENSGAAIEAGRYISSRVYVEAKQTNTGNSQVQVDVDLTKHLKLQTRLGNGTAVTQGTTPENDPGSSIGLSYQFEY
jgi:translocation and assembly module TamB